MANRIQGVADDARLADEIRAAGSIVVLAGAALAAEAGIPPRPGSLDWRIYGSRMRRIHDAAPGPGHLAVRRLQDLGLLRAVVTDSDDVLLAEAGVRDVISLAGSVALSVCPACGYSEPLGCVLALLPLPRCAACGALLEPDVAPAGGALRHDAVQRATGVVRTAPLVVATDELLADRPLTQLCRVAGGPILLLAPAAAGTLLAAAARRLSP